MRWHINNIDSWHYQTASFSYVLFYLQMIQGGIYRCKECSIWNPSDQQSWYWWCRINLPLFFICMLVQSLVYMTVHLAVKAGWSMQHRPSVYLYVLLCYSAGSYWFSCVHLQTFARLKLRYSSFGNVGKRTCGKEPQSVNHVYEWQVKQ